jgi:hypothetical protein
MRSAFAAIVKRLISDCASILQRLRSSNAAIAKGSQSGKQSIQGDKK